MELFLDTGDQRSLTTQLYDQISSTVTDAYARLTAEGYVEGRRGGGSIVLGHASHQPELSEAPTALAPTAQAATMGRYGMGLESHPRYDLTAGRVDTRLFPLADWPPSRNPATRRSPPCCAPSASTWWASRWTSRALSWTRCPPRRGWST